MSPPCRYDARINTLELVYVSSRLEKKLNHCNSVCITGAREGRRNKDLFRANIVKSRKSQQKKAKNVNYQ